MEPESNRILVELEVKEGHDFQDTYDRVMAKMFKHEPVVEGCEICKTYVPGYCSQNIVERIRKEINQTLDDIKSGL